MKKIVIIIFTILILNSYVTINTFATVSDAKTPPMTSEEISKEADKIDKMIEAGKVQNANLEKYAKEKQEERESAEEGDQDKETGTILGIVGTIIGFIIYKIVGKKNVLKGNQSGKYKTNQIITTQLFFPFSEKLFKKIYYRRFLYLFLPGVASIILILFLMSLGEGSLKDAPTFIVIPLFIVMLGAIFSTTFVAIPYYLTTKSHLKKSSITVNNSNLVYTFINNNLNYYIYTVKNVDNSIIKDNVLIIEGVIIRNKYLEGNINTDDISLLKIPLVFDNMENIYGSRVESKVGVASAN